MSRDVLQFEITDSSLVFPLNVAAKCVYKEE